MSHRNICANCGNEEFEEEDGVLVCTQCGRQHEAGFQTVDDSGDFGTQGKLSRKGIEKRKVKVTKIYRGVKAYRLYLQAWQHILWKQSYTLIYDLVKAPSELWTVVRDLWTLRLAHLSARLDNKELLSLTMEDAMTSNPTDESNLESENEFPQASTSHHLKFSPTVWDTISHVYLSVLLLRLPLSLRMVYQWARTEELPFIRAIRHVPYDMTSRLPQEYQRALDTTTVPTMPELQHAVFNLAHIYNQDSGILFPPLNWKILLFEWLQSLGLPIEVYSSVKQLVTLSGYDFTYDLNSDQQEHRRGSSNKPRRTPVAWPEMQLISLIVIAMKMLFPLPISTIRTTIHTEDQTDSAKPSPNFDWHTWRALHKNHYTPLTQHFSIPPGKEIETHDTDVLDMSDDAIDAYMNWYQRTFATPDSILATKKTDIEKSILDMFPLPSTPHPTNEPSHIDDHANDLSRRIQAEALLPTTQNTPANQTTTSTSYQVFPTIESLEATNSIFEGGADKNPVLYFHEQAADVACVDLKSLVSAVRYTERRLERWVGDRRRRDVFGEEDDEVEE